MQPTEAADLIQQPLKSRRHQDPPRFWWRMLTTSVLVHGLMLAIAYPIIRMTTAGGNGQAGEPTPVELLDASAIDWAAIDARNQAEAAAASPDLAAVPAPAELPSDAPLPPASTEAAPDIPQFVPSDLTPAPSTFNPSAPIPPSDFPLEEPVQSPPFNSPAPPPSPVAPAPQPNIPTPLPDPSRLPDPFPSDAVGSTGPLPGGLPDPNAIPGPDLIQLPNPPVVQNPVPGGGDSTLPGADPGAGEPAGPPGYVASLSASAVPLDQATDLPDESARPVNTTVSVSTNPLVPGSCPFSPDLDGSLGAAVSLNIVVEANGQVSNITSVDASGVSLGYLEFAQCVIRQAQFTPATTAGTTVASNLIVTVSLSRE